SLSPGSVSDTIAPVSTCLVSGTGGANSWYMSSVSVSLTATDDRSGVAAIHFLIDGSAWQAYTGAVVVQGEGQHTVEYAATDVAGNVEAAQSSIVRISRSLSSPPVTTLNLAGTLGANGWYISSVAVTLQATSPSGGTISIAYSIDGGAWATYGQ